MLETQWICITTNILNNDDLWRLTPNQRSQVETQAVAVITANFTPNATEAWGEPANGFQPVPGTQVPDATPAQLVAFLNAKLAEVNAVVAEIAAEQQPPASPVSYAVPAASPPTKQCCKNPKSGQHTDSLSFELEITHDNVTRSWIEPINVDGVYFPVLVQFGIALVYEH